ncbi:MAG: hypothetical protein HUK24_05425, partial [Sphaerochaetaceae bacterium]|nr:hypothetical protein [Sphaerochaetaceae bacterium]
LEGIDNSDSIKDNLFREFEIYLSNSIKNAEIIARSSVDAIYQEQAKTFDALTDSESSVELGKMLNASHAVDVRITSDGKTYKVTVQYADIEKGTIKTGSVKDTKSLFALSSCLQDVAKEFATFLRQVKRNTLDVSGALMLQDTNIVKADAKVGYSYMLIKPLSIGAWGGVRYSKDSHSFLPVAGAKVIVGEPEKIAGFVSGGVTINQGSMSLIASAGLYVFNFIVEYYPLSLMGVPKGQGLGIGYSVSF